MTNEECPVIDGSVFRDNFAIHHTLPDDESELARDAEHDGARRRLCMRALIYFREHPGDRSVTAAALMPVKSLKAATLVPRQSPQGRLVPE